MKLTYSDVLIVPKFSTIESRADVDLSNSMGQKLPIISSNMKDVTESEMANAMASQGAIGALHRFCTIEENVEMFLKSPKETFCSIGVGDEEYQRFLALYEVGARNIIIDVANGASIKAVEQFKKLYDFTTEKKDFCYIVVGNFASVEGISGFFDGFFDYWHELNCHFVPDAIKIGIGSGSICITREKTGVGYPQLSAIQEIKKYIIDRGHEHVDIIADGGITCVGDIAKSLAAGADLVMLGSMLAGTTESSGKLLDPMNEYRTNSYVKVYRGSAANNYSDGNRTNEGVESVVPYKGSVIDVLKDIEGGLRSSFSYVDARNLTEFRKNVEFVQVSQNTVIENGSHVNGIITRR